MGAADCSVDEQGYEPRHLSYWLGSPQWGGHGGGKKGMKNALVASWQPLIQVAELFHGDLLDSAGY